jgi:hypothetical protein
MRLVLLVTIALLGLAAPAGAATVSAAVDPGGCLKAMCVPPVRTIAFAAEPGERNTVRVTRDGTLFRFRDEGAGLRAGAACSAVDAHEVTCDAPGDMHNAVRIDLGDGDDRLASSAALEAYGRDGADELAASGEDAATFYGGDGADRLTGGDGDDRLYGDGGGDALAGGDGDDALAGDAHDATIPTLAADDLAGPSADTIDGGPGADRVVYSRRPRTVVTVDLRTGTGGQPGERDTLTSIEGATGNDEDDVLLGDAGDNALVSGNGADVVYGGAGDDTLDSYGAARLFGDEGDDFVRAYRAARVSCGDGADRVQILVVVALGGDCELFVSQGASGTTETQVAPVALTTTRAVVRVTCVPQPYSTTCRQPVIVQTVQRLRRVRACRRVDGRRRCTVKRRRLTLGSRESPVIANGQTVDVVVPFTRAGRAIRRRRPAPRLRVLVTRRDVGFGWVLPR